jgi:putative beta-lysine N-acetyltransferase
MVSDLPKTEEIFIKDGKALIKMDTFNQRIKIITCSGDLESLLNKLIASSENQKISKIFSIVSYDDIDTFKKQNFIIEAKIDQFIKGEPGYFVSKFLNSDRKMSLYLPEEEEVLIKSREYITQHYTHSTYDYYTIRNGTKEDAKALANLYNEVFETYPSPMNDPHYIQKAMNNNTCFKVAVFNGKIVSAASADMDSFNMNVEMTDCATTKNHRGNGLMGRLIFELEKDLRKKDYKVLYSTARAISTGINIVFAKHDYMYGGRLVNHCHICGQFENMNIWLKVL